MLSTKKREIHFQNHSNLTVPLNMKKNPSIKKKAFIFEHHLQNHMHSPQWNEKTFKPFP